MAEWAEATPEQLERIGELSMKWRQEEEDPVLSAGAAMVMILNFLARDVEPDDRLEVIEGFRDTMMRQEMADRGESETSRTGLVQLSFVKLQQ